MDGGDFTGMPKGAKGWSTGQGQAIPSSTECPALSWNSSAVLQSLHPAWPEQPPCMVVFSLCVPLNPPWHHILLVRT